MTLFPPPFDEVQDTARPRRRARVLAVVVVVVVIAGAMAGWLRERRANVPPTPAPTALTDSAAYAPSGVQIRVRVLNMTQSRGLAKRATAVLRDFGYDVVDYDTDIQPPSTPTRIIAHTGQMEWAQRLRRAVGVGAIGESPDSLRYVDFTVFIGSDWQPPTQSLRP